MHECVVVIIVVDLLVRRTCNPDKKKPDGGQPDKILGYVPVRKPSTRILSELNSEATKKYLKDQENEGSICFVVL